MLRIVAMALLLAPAPLAMAQGLAPSTAARQDEAMAQARLAWEALPEDERRAIQEDLVWAGTYRGMADGAFGRLTFAALAAITAKRPGAQAGILDAQERAALGAAADKARRAAGFERLAEPRSGATIGLPRTLLPRRADIAEGARFETQDRAAALETFRLRNADETALPTLYEGLRAPQPNRRVTYSILRPEFFVIAAETPTQASYIRAGRGADGDLRGFRMVWPRTQQERFERLVVAVANAFDPSGAPPSAGAPAERAPQQSASQNQTPRRIVSAALALGERRFVAFPSESCAEPRIGDAPATLVRTDAATGLALYSVNSGTTRSFALPAAGAAGPALVFFTDGEAVEAASGDVVLHENGERRLRAALPAEAAGALVLSRAGEWLGLVGPAPEKLRLAGAPPPISRPLIAATRVTEFASAASSPSGPNASSPTAGSLAIVSAASLKPLSCAR